MKDSGSYMKRRAEDVARVRRLAETSFSRPPVGNGVGNPLGMYMENFGAGQAHTNGILGMVL